MVGNLVRLYIATVDLVVGSALPSAAWFVRPPLRRLFRSPSPPQASLSGPSLSRMHDPKPGLAPTRSWSGSQRCIPSRSHVSGRSSVECDDAGATGGGGRWASSFPSSPSSSPPSFPDSKTKPTVTETRTGARLGQPEARAEELEAGGRHSVGQATWS